MRGHIPSFAPAETPISDLNTTPLIDVMLVLLIMFIITIPISTHKVPMDLPGEGPLSNDPVVYRLELDRGGHVRLELDRGGHVRLDGAPIARSALPARLIAIAKNPAAELHLRTDGEAPYERFDQLLATIKRAGVIRLGMIDNDRFVAAIG